MTTPESSRPNTAGSDVSNVSEIILNNERPQSAKMKEFNASEIKQKAEDKIKKIRSQIDLKKRNLSRNNNNDVKIQELKNEIQELEEKKEKFKSELQQKLLANSFKIEMEKLLNAQQGEQAQAKALLENRLSNRPFSSSSSRQPLVPIKFNDFDFKSFLLGDENTIKLNIATKNTIIICKALMKNVRIETLNISFQKNKPNNTPPYDIVGNILILTTTNQHTDIINHLTFPYAIDNLPSSQNSYPKYIGGITDRPTD